jgi:putative endonuclease
LSHLEFGADGERFAAKYLEALGWRIIDRNVRVGSGELDIVAMDRGELVVVEVRSRRVGMMMPPEASVGPRKLRRLIRTAKKYVEKVSYAGNWRIDIAAVTEDRGGSFRIELFSDATAGMEGVS